VRPISICMPYWNRPAEWTRSRAAYERLYPDMDIEFSIADDGSIMPLSDSKSKVTRLPTKMGPLNPCVPINVSVRNATRDIIVLTNPEIEHRERVLDRMLEALSGPNDYVMTGCRDTLRGDWYAGPDAPRCPVGGRQPIPPGTELHFCVMFHRSLFERVGGFDESYRNLPGCDDNDWLWSLYALGDVSFKYVPSTVWHYRTPHRWPGSLAQSAARLKSKWGHLPEYQACGS
jgi:hypothetical protein